MTMTSTGIDNTYNGWTNYETWNVALYINNEEPLYREAVRYAKQCDRLGEFVNYNDFADVISMLYGNKTADGVDWNDTELDIEELNEMLKEMVDG